MSKPKQPEHRKPHSSTVGSNPSELCRGGRWYLQYLMQQTNLPFCSRKRHDFGLPRLFATKILETKDQNQMPSMLLLQAHAEMPETPGELCPNRSPWPSREGCWEEALLRRRTGCCSLQWAEWPSHDSNINSTCISRDSYSQTLC